MNSAPALAKAAVDLLSDPDRWHAAQAAGIARVERFYTQELMFGQYRTLYRNALGEAKQAPDGTAAPDKR